MVHRKQKTIRRRTSRKTSKEEVPRTTFHGLHIWYRHLFEHLGWMVLAHKRGYHDKTHAYKNSIRRLKESIANAEKELKEPDRQRDLAILRDDVETLEKHAKRDF